jgi:hypothetical protein
MATFKEQLVSDMAATFCASSDFGEAVTYKKKNGTTRSIYALVVRMPPDASDINPGVRLIVKVANSATTGITAAEVDPGGDTISVPIRPGEAAEYLRVFIPAREPEFADEGMLTLELG